MAKSSYYYYQHHKDYKSNKDKEEYALINKICSDKNHKAGIRTIYMILKNKYNKVINLKKIYRLKKEYGIITKIRKKNPYNVAFKKGLKHRTAPNLLNQDFKIKEYDKVYSTDVSYLIYNNSQRAYLSAVKDLATKEIVGFNICSNMSLDLVYKGFEELLKDKSGLIIHSDQGSHYTHPMYVNMLKDNGVIQSMSRKGNCLDNAPIESFFGHMKDEIDLKSCQSFQEVKELVENYIYYYNNERCQWNLNKMTPLQYRRHLLMSLP